MAYQLATAPSITLVDGTPTTTSNDLARFFGKAHDDVLRRIRTLVAQLDADHARNFAEMVNEVEIGGGAIRKDPAYRLTRDGFTLLAMGFTGKRALQFKLAYIEAFNRMEAELKSQRQLPGTITPEQQAFIQASIAALSRHTGIPYQELYSRLHARFRVAKYTQIPAADFPYVTEYLRNFCAIDSRAAEDLARALLLGGMTFTVTLGRDGYQINTGGPKAIEQPSLPQIQPADLPRLIEQGWLPQAQIPSVLSALAGKLAG